MEIGGALALSSEVVGASVELFRFQLKFDGVVKVGSDVERQTVIVEVSIGLNLVIVTFGVARVDNVYVNIKRVTLLNGVSKGYLVDGDAKRREVSVLDLEVVRTGSVLVVLGIKHSVNNEVVAYVEFTVCTHIESGNCIFTRPTSTFRTFNVVTVFVHNVDTNIVHITASERVVVFDVDLNTRQVIVSVVELVVVNGDGVSTDDVEGVTFLIRIVSNVFNVYGRRTVRRVKVNIDIDVGCLCTGFFFDSDLELVIRDTDDACIVGVAFSDRGIVDNCTIKPFCSDGDITFFSVTNLNVIKGYSMASYRGITLVDTYVLINIKRIDVVNLCRRRRARKRCGHGDNGDDHNHGKEQRTSLFTI
nr:hypothetical protein [Natrarchaeobaculum sulfurireducens]